MINYIYKGGRKLYYYGSYSSWEQAIITAKRFKKKNHSSYFILQSQGKYKLFMNRAFTL